MENITLEAFIKEIFLAIDQTTKALRKLDYPKIKEVKIVAKTNKTHVTGMEASIFLGFKKSRKEEYKEESVITYSFDHPEPVAGLKKALQYNISELVIPLYLQIASDLVQEISTAVMAIPDPVPGGYRIRMPKYLYQRSIAITKEKAGTFSIEIWKGKLGAENGTTDGIYHEVQIAFGDAKTE